MGEDKGKKLNESLGKGIDWNRQEKKRRSQKGRKGVGKDGERSKEAKRREEEGNIQRAAAEGIPKNSTSSHAGQA